MAVVRVRAATCDYKVEIIHVDTQIVPTRLYTLMIMILQA